MPTRDVAVGARHARTPRRRRAARRTGRSGSPSGGRDRSSSCGGRRPARRSRSRARGRAGSSSRSRAGSAPAACPGCARQTGARARGSRREVLELAAAEHLRPRLQVDVDLEADDRFPAHRQALGGTVVEVERLLERVTGAEEQVLRRTAGRSSCRPTGQAFGEAARDRQAGKARPCSAGSRARRSGTSRAGCRPRADRERDRRRRRADEQRRSCSSAARSSSR